MGETPLADGRDAFARERWTAAFAALSTADRLSPLDAIDLERLAIAASLIGEDATGVTARTRAHTKYLDHDDRVGAARCAFWLAFTMLDDPHQRAQASGWLTRAERLLADCSTPCVEEGWLLCAVARKHAATGDLSASLAAFRRAAAVGETFRSADLIALARHGEGRARLGLRDAAGGLAVLDDVMLSVTAGEVGPIVAGVIYCSVISACYDHFDLRRAHEWTAAFQRWCLARPDVSLFRGHCLIRRSEVLHLQGAWADALEEVRRACERLAATSGQRDAGAAYYQLAEMHRARGEWDEADRAYRLASQSGRTPYPGLALLRLAQGHAGAAATAIRVALGDARDGRLRVHLLDAAVEILVEAGDLDGAGAAATELAAMAERAGRPAFLRAIACEAQGAVVLASGRPADALAPLGDARGAWSELQAPYRTARVRVLAGRAARDLGDHEGSRLEFEAALEVFERLGAAADAARLSALLVVPSPRPASPLTGRDVEVLRLVATGASNRAIADRLAISEKTVARHLSNIFVKLDLPSRAAATAYAYEHQIIRR
jgi:DNA-binding CsgD family transcriptional regulator